MAGDWIKMRGELFTHPKFIALSNCLIFSDKASQPFLTYVCGEDALDIGVLPPSNETVTERALRIVTEQALRDVTMTALLRVWCAVNTHCKVVDMDAICSPMTLYDLDIIAGFYGFAEALEDVGWVECDSDNSTLIFRNFLEYNEPACLRQRPLSNAERQLRYREKQKQSSNTVTKVTKRNAREEKRRYKEPPTPLELPEPLNTERFTTMYVAWCAYKQERREGYKPTGETQLISRMAAVARAKGVDAVIAAMQKAMSNGWKGWEHDSSFGVGGKNGVASDPAAYETVTAEEFARLYRAGKFKGKPTRHATKADCWYGILKDNRKVECENYPLPTEANYA
jgi:hypothetical protein